MASTNQYTYMLDSSVGFVTDFRTSFDNISLIISQNLFLNLESDNITGISYPTRQPPK